MPVTQTLDRRRQMKLNPTPSIKAPPVFGAVDPKPNQCLSSSIEAQSPITGGRCRLKPHRAVYIYRNMDVGDEMQKVYCWTAQIGNLVLLLLWHILHFVISVWYCALGIAHMLESYIISSGLLRRYKALNLDRLQFLAVVVDSEEAHQISKVTELLQWLRTIGVKNVCLYDTEGVLKKSKEAILERLHVTKVSEEATKNVTLLDQKHLNVEFASYPDGKEAVAKAANVLFVKYYMGRDQKEQNFTESHVAEALRTVGSRGPDPDLLLIYGPARCHLGFPAWRIRYTEIVHMGPLKSMRYGSLRKAIQKFTMVRQNYGK